MEPNVSANGSKPKKIELPKLNLQAVSVRLVGLTPIIVHNWDPKSLREMEDKQQGKAANKKEARDPAAECGAARILDAAGRDCIKAVYLKKCMMSSFRYIRDFKRTELTGALFVDGQLIPLESKPFAMRTDTVRIHGGTTTLRYRPEYQDWSVRATIVFQSNVISIEQVLNVLNVAGYSIGLCEWRPEKDGDFGRFKLDGASVEVKEVFHV
jgi:hypothetical protein